jgi:hypothetical protein
VTVYVNATPTSFVQPYTYTVGGEPGDIDTRFPEDSYTTNLLTESGPQQITAKVLGDPRCGPGTTLEKLRVVVVELG